MNNDPLEMSERKGKFRKISSLLFADLRQFNRTSTCVRPIHNSPSADFGLLKLTFLIDSIRNSFDQRRLRGEKTRKLRDLFQLSQLFEIQTEKM
jgi:hypothetical protein